MRYGERFAPVISSPARERDRFLETFPAQRLATNRATPFNAETPWNRGGVQCKAWSRQNQRRCRNYALCGQAVCRFHGGASPQARRKAAERLLTAVHPTLATAVLRLPLG